MSDTEEDQVDTTILSPLSAGGDEENFDIEGGGGGSGSGSGSEKKSNNGEVTYDDDVFEQEPKTTSEDEGPLSPRAIKDRISTPVATIEEESTVEDAASPSTVEEPMLSRPSSLVPDPSGAPLLDIEEEEEKEASAPMPPPLLPQDAPEKLPMRECSDNGKKGVMFTEGSYKSLKAHQFDAIIMDLNRQVESVQGGSCLPSKNNETTLGSDGWIETISTIQGRAIDKFWKPWLVCTVNAIFWSSLVEGHDEVDGVGEESGKNLRTAFTLGLSSTLSFLLVFRLNRSILRFWEGVQAWGNNVTKCRSLAMATLIHGRERPFHRDQVVIWTAALVICAKRKLRFLECNYEDFEDLLPREAVDSINQSNNPPLYAANELRFHLKCMLDVTKESGPLSPARSGEMRMHEAFLDAIIVNIGKCENIMNTPVPLVYIAHLRTFLMVYLLALPYLVHALWGWGTIPIVSITAFIMLGIEGASVEVECPFEKGQVNDLNLDRYCLEIMMDIQQLVAAQNAREKKME